MKYIFLASTVILLYILAPYTFGQTRGEGWQLYYIDDTTRNKYYFDKGSLTTVEKDIVRVWQKVTEEIKSTDEQEKFSIQLQINCRQKTFDVLSVVNLLTTQPEIEIYASEQGKKRRYIEGGQLRALVENICP